MEHQSAVVRQFGSQAQFYLTSSVHAQSHDDFRALVEAKTQRFAGVRAAHRPARSAAESRK